ncbi:MAG TPA: hypothetical protein VGI60_14220 [Chthoniobacterales bacterium]|jgi:tetratricopeptide (TPR) repeat protein
MNFSDCSRLLLVPALAFAIGTSGCARRLSQEEKNVRSELRQALRAHQFTHAIPLARQVLQFSPHDDGAWQRLAQAQCGARDFTGLETTLANWRAATKTPSSKYDEYRGELAVANGRPTEAIAAWRQAAAEETGKTRVWARIARLEQEQENWSQAAPAWMQATKGADDPGYLVNRATCYRHLHKWEAVRVDLQRAQELAPQDALVRQELTRFNRLGKFLQEVRELDRQLQTLPDDAGLLGDRALLFLRAGDPALALDDAKRAAQLAPSAVRPKLFCALAARALGREAEATVLPGLRVETLSPEFLQVISRLDVEIAAEPKDAELLTNRAWHLNEIGQAQLALADARSALAAEPKSADACAEAGYALAKLQRKTEAYGEIGRATELDPTLATAWQYRGELEMQRDDYNAAIDSLTHALSINQTAAALTKREECYRKMGLLAKAEDDHKALEQFGVPPRKTP